jgi:hypothetical protein
LGGQVADVGTARSSGGDWNDRDRKNSMSDRDRKNSVSDRSDRNSISMQQGFIASLKDKFGFIETADHQREVFFHFRYCFL